MLVLVAGSGARCVPRTWPGYSYGPQAPRLLPEAPTVEQVVEVVNNNSRAVHSYYTTDAKISAPGVPTLRANIALERPRRFRLRASTSLTGPEVDLGSNDDLFWLWVRRNQPPALYFCRHDQFASSPARQMLPINPVWLIDALGMPILEPSWRHSNLRALDSARLEIRSDVPTPEGLQIRMTVVDARYGFVLEQHLFTPEGRRLASSITSRHRYDPVSAVSLPAEVEIQMPGTDLNLRIDVGNVQINSPLGDPAQLWAKPSYDGYSEMNVGGPSAGFSQTSSPQRVAPANYPVYRIERLPR